MKPAVPIDVDADTGIWTVDAMPMILMPRHFFLNNHLEIEAALGAQTYADLLFTMIERRGERSFPIAGERALGERALMAGERRDHRAARGVPELRGSVRRRGEDALAIGRERRRR